ncbi:hypothetical protein CEXT_198771 [Caerostris extrusa]|uniref:Uncharacterized protein n=1 Tax=Caerostris extrusa TaxID=172846 RepID=A0AAV4SMN7_CAEEX|nr:hypothetical protein CEXT_198771 [Caerostris extrusa]
MKHLFSSRSIAKLKPSQTKVLGFSWDGETFLHYQFSNWRSELSPYIIWHEVRLVLIRIQRIVLLAAVDKHYIRPLSRMSHNSDVVESVYVLTRQIL